MTGSGKAGTGDAVVGGLFPVEDGVAELPPEATNWCECGATRGKGDGTWRWLTDNTVVVGVVVAFGVAEFGTAGDTSDGLGPPPVNELNRARNFDRAPDFGRDAEVCESLVETVLPLDWGRTSGGRGDKAFCNQSQRQFQVMLAIIRRGNIRENAAER